MMPRAGVALALAGGVAFALVRCGGDLESAPKPPAPIPSAPEAMSSPPSDSSEDARACGPRGTLVQGAAPPASHDIKALDARRRLYWSEVQGRCVVFMRRSAETAQEEGLCVSEASTIMALSANGRLGGLEGTPQKLVVVSAADPAWRVGDAGYATTAELGAYPDPPEAGPWGGFRAGTFVGQEDSFVAAGAGNGISAAIAVRFVRGDGGYVASHYVETRLNSFIDVAPSGNGGVWALGIDINRRAFLVKLTAANTLDTSASGGFIEIDPGPINDASLGVDGQGRAVALVFSRVTSLPTPPTPPVPARLIRVLPDGRVDPSYGVGGRLTLPLSGSGSTLVVERSGAVLAGGSVLLEDGGARHAGVARFEPDGTLDRSFGGATAPFLLQPGASRTDDLEPGGVTMVRAPESTAPGCEPEFAAKFLQRTGGGLVYLFQ